MFLGKAIAPRFCLSGNDGGGYLFELTPPAPLPMNKTRAAMAKGARKK